MTDGGTAQKRLILHIGTHKTGTSSFQRSLQNNAQSLIGAGIRPIRERVPAGPAGPAVRRTNLMGIAHLFLRDELLTGARIRGGVERLSPEQRALRIDTLADRLRNAKEDTVLLSAEVFCFLRTADEQARLKAFLDNTGRAVETIVVFRDDAAWRASWNDQLAKDPRVRQRLEGVPVERSIRGEWYFDKDAIRAFWRPFNLREIGYEASANIVETLYRAIGGAAPGLETAFYRNRRSGRGGDDGAAPPDGPPAPAGRS